MGAGGGGSTSGSTDYPQYMKDFHGMILDQNGQDLSLLPNSAMKSYATAVAGSSPYYNFMSIRSGDDIVSAFMGAGKSLSSYAKIFEMLEDWQNLDFDYLYTNYTVVTPNINTLAYVSTITDIATVADITSVTGIADISNPSRPSVTPVAGIAEVTEIDYLPIVTGDSFLADLSTSLDDDIAINLAPKLKEEMRGIGAVMSSAFIIGDVLLADSKLKALAKSRVDVEQQIVLATHNVNTQRKQENIDVAKFNLANTIEPGKINTSTELELHKITSGNTGEFAKVNLSNRIEVARLNATNKLEVAKLNGGFKLEVAKLNSMNQIEVDKINNSNKLAVLEMNRLNRSAAIQQALSYIELKKSFALVSADTVKVFLSLSGDMSKHYADLAASDLKWDLEMLQYVNNTLASISGAALNAGQVIPGAGIGGAISGALSGAAAGAMIGGPMGAGIGGALGLAGGLFK